MGFKSRSGLACVLSLLLLGVSACSQPPDCHRQEVFCAGLVTDTNGLNDLGLNQNTWAGLEQSRADGVIDQAAYIESVDARDYEKNIAYFVDEGYDVIVTSGPGLRTAALHSADLYPDPVFIGMNQSEADPPPNFVPVTFPEDQMGFLAGVLAARLSGTDTVGAVCETSGIGSMWRYCEGFRAGVAYSEEPVKAIIVYRDDGSRDKLFNDPEWGAETALSLIQQGADVIFAAGGNTAGGALRAAGGGNVRAIGVERDQRAVLGDEGLGVIASFWGSAGSTVQELMRTIKAGNPPEAGGNPVEFILLEEVIPRGLTAELNGLLSDLADGTVKTNVTFEKK
jgi:basic membrane protein A